MEIFFIIFLVSFAHCGKIEDSKDQQWENFKLKFDKQYKNLDHEFERKSIFLSTLESIEKHNVKYEQGISTYYQGVNSFSDWTWDEFKSQYLNSNMDNMNKSVSSFFRQQWYFVTKIVLTYCEKKSFSDREKLFKFEAEGRKFEII